MGKFRKHFHALVGALVLCLSLTTAIAETYPGYTTQNLNVRVASGGEGKIVAHLDTDEDVLVIGEEQAKGKGWLLVEVEKNGETVQGYVLKSGVERAVQMQMYSGIYSLTSLRTENGKTRRQAKRVLRRRMKPQPLSTRDTACTPALFQMEREAETGHSSGKMGKTMSANGKAIRYLEKAY